MKKKVDESGRSLDKDRILKDKNISDLTEYISKNLNDDLQPLKMFDWHPIEQGKGKYKYYRKKEVEYNPEIIWKRGKNNRDYLSWNQFHLLPEDIQIKELEKHKIWGIKTGWQHRAQKWISVIDIDIPNNDPKQAEDRYKAIMKEIGETFTTKTPSGGYHLFYELPTFISDRKNIDFRNYLRRNDKKRTPLEMELKNSTLVVEKGPGRGVVNPVPIMVHNQFDYCLNHFIELLTTENEDGLKYVQYGTQDLEFPFRRVKTAQKSLSTYTKHEDLDGLEKLFKTAITESGLDKEYCDPKNNTIRNKDISLAINGTIHNLGYNDEERAVFGDVFHDIVETNNPRGWQRRTAFYEQVPEIHKGIPLLKKVLPASSEKFISILEKEHGHESDLNSNSEKPVKIRLKYPTTHLRGFEELKNATALYGGEYTPISKNLWYCLYSYPIRISQMGTGQIKLDGRISPMFVLKSGRGKGEIKRVIKGFVKLCGGVVREPTSLHAEQLVGKSVWLKREKEHEERRGYLNADFLIIDEAFNLLSSKELHYSEARKYIRTALDTYPHNTVTKQLVELGEDHALEYAPECPITIFVQPLRFENDKLVLEGDLRRFLVVYIHMGNSDKSDALKRRVFDSYNGEEELQKFCDIVKSLDVPKNFKMSNEAKVRFAELSILLVKHGEAKQQKIANFMEMIAYIAQNTLLKFSAVQAFQNNRSVIEVVDVNLAYVDLFEAMEHMYDFVNRKIPGSLDYGEGWQGAISKEQEALKWLKEMGATSEENTTVSNKAYVDKIKSICNVEERQAQNHKNKHVKKGWIKSKTAPNVSKVWLNFTPKNSTDATDATDATDRPYVEYKKIVKKISNTQSFTSRSGVYVAPVTPVNSANILGPESTKIVDAHNQDEYTSMDDEELHVLAYTGGDEAANDELAKRLIAEQTRQKEGGK